MSDVPKDRDEEEGEEETTFATDAAVEGFEAAVLGEDEDKDDPEAATVRSAERQYEAIVKGDDKMALRRKDIKKELKDLFGDGANEDVTDKDEPKDGTSDDAKAAEKTVSSPPLPTDIPLTSSVFTRLGRIDASAPKKE